jgi:hypothetical protein
MNKKKSFDCVEFQRKVREENYLNANGNYDLMISNLFKRIEQNEQYRLFLEGKAKQVKNKLNL